MRTGTLKELCSLVTDGTHDTPKTLDNGVPFIKAKEITGGVIDFDNCEYISYKDHLEVIARSKPEKGDILFAHIGASLGETALIKTDIEFSIKNVALFKANPAKINNRYLYYHITSPQFQGELKAKRTGSAQPFVGLDTLRSHVIKYHPDLTEQARIASILSAYDDLIENNTKRIKILEEVARLIYREWFVEFKAPGIKLRKATPEEKKVTGKLASRLSGGDVFPEGWEIKTLSEIAGEKRRGIDPTEIEPETPYLGLEHLPRKSIALDNWGMAKEVQSTKLAFFKNEILFGKIRPYFHKVGVAPVSGVCSSDIIVIVPKTDNLFGLVLSCVSSKAFVSQATQSSQGTKMPRANWDMLLKYPIIFPNEELLNDFNNIYIKQVELIIALVMKNRNLRQTRDLLLPKLISGEVAV